MKLLLIQPPVQDFYDTDIRLQPIGLCYLEAAVKQYLPGVEVVIKDFHQGWGRRTIPLPRELAYLKNYYPWPDESPFCSFYHYYHFGAPLEVIAAEVIKIRPDLVGISSLFSPYYREVFAVADVIKSKLAVPVLTGGSNVSAIPEVMLSHPAIDFVIRGEGERPLVEFLKVWSTGRDFSMVPNLGWKKDGQTIFNEMEDNFPIETLPVPDFSDLRRDRYEFEKRPLSFVITSRSCPHRCSFCSVHQTFGMSYRRRSVDDVLDEIRRRYSEGIRVFDFEDDNLTFYVKEMKELCRRLVREFPKRDVQFLAMNGISYLSLDSELLRLMKDAGFTHLNLALVSSDTTVRETTKRPHTTEKYLEVVGEASRLGFKIVSYQILGLPNETLESMIQTLAFEARLPILLGASMFYLTPNSPIARSFPKPAPEDIFKARLTAMAIETEHFQREDIYTLFVTTRIINFLKGIPLEREEVDFVDALETAKRLDRRSQTGARILRALFEEGKLYAAVRNDLKPLPKFKTDIFQKVWDQLGVIGTQGGKKIRIPKFSEAPSQKQRVEPEDSAPENSRPQNQISIPDEARLDFH